MADEKELEMMHSNQRLLVMELQARGVNVELLVPEIELLEATYKGHKEFLLDRDSSINPYPSSVISGDKYLTKLILQRAGISVVQGQQFSEETREDALVYAQHLGYPLVVKPCFGSHGDEVHTDLDNLCLVDTAITSVVNSIGPHRQFIVEKQYEGMECRVFITRNGDYAVLHRDPAHVIGNGNLTIKELADNETKRRMNPRTTALCPIALDEAVDQYLARFGKDLAYIPSVNEKVYLRHTSNVAKGATCEDYTDLVHPSVIEISRKVLEAFPGMPYAGIDFLSKDITKEQTPESYIIIEVNSVPGVHMHMRPGSGTSRNVARYIADMIFPETKTGIYGAAKHNMSGAENNA
jgi:cyanophycin synthetase